MPSDYLLNPNMTVSVETIGAEGARLLIVDDFLASTEALMVAAASAVFIPVGPVYPGVRAPAPVGYVDLLSRTIGPLIEQAFGAACAPELELCAYSMVTSAPGELRPAQCMPHTDGAAMNKVAILHYLCPPEYGGTAFYRHRSTGFEIIDAERVRTYRDKLKEDVAAHGLPPQAYITGDTPIFEQIAAIEARVNRLIAYRGSSLHSGQIPPDLSCVEDPQTGRLTVNAFANLMPDAEH